MHCGNISVTAILNDSTTARKLWDVLPIETKATTWGGEIYFTIPVNMDEENSKTTVSAGDIAYWPPGRAFCIFFGITPASIGDEIRPASPVNIIGRIEGDLKIFKNVITGMRVRITRCD
ncbi:MAG: cyclophilin-like fold protein [bacterium]|nr:cyclophilin-like fold protein [bacterium]MDD3805492.1 cyclophilin-like fold protein [bacterium]MDD4152941.1 cyclophilin-like fold protein [bacterium]MDD4557405.1 cyclophilin-like fold protein [bacterium]